MLINIFVMTIPTSLLFELQKFILAINEFNIIYYLLLVYYLLNGGKKIINLNTYCCINIFTMNFYKIIIFGLVTIYGSF